MSRKKTSAKARKFRFYLVLTLIAAAIIIFFINGPRGTMQFIRASKEKHQLELEIENLNRQKLKLQEEKERLENDPEYIKKYAREKYNMKQEGEQVYDLEKKK